MYASTCYVLVFAKVVKIFDICKGINKILKFFLKIFFEKLVYWYEGGIIYNHSSPVLGIGMVPPCLWKEALH